MIKTRQTRRRAVGLIFIGLAIAMLVAGETVLPGRLAGATFICYWLGCLLLTALAALIALVDAARVRTENREEQRRLIQNTLEQIERERQARPPKHP